MRDNFKLKIWRSKKIMKYYNTRRTRKKYQTKTLEATRVTNARRLKIKIVKTKASCHGHICVVHFCICPCHCALARFWIWLEALCQLICSAEMPFKFFPLLSFLGLSWVWSESRASSLDDGRRSLCRRLPPWGHYLLKNYVWILFSLHFQSKMQGNL